jgi:transcriptional regulator with XRE-family HTH domain
MSNPVDVYVGKKLRVLRNLRGLSQTELGKLAGVTFQQIQKYEKGKNRIGSSRLHLIAQVLGVPVNYFFDGYQPEQKEGNIEAMLAIPPAAGSSFALSYEPHEYQALHYFKSIKNPDIQKKMLALLKSLAEG